MTPPTHASLFSGIGGFDLAAEWAGWTNLFNCEKDAFCQRVLKYHFPDAIQYSDIRDTDFTIWRGRIDVLTGGFPCQPFSNAGKRKGTDDDRYLWPEMLRAIREIRPRWIVGENVRGIVNWNAGMVFEQVCADLESEGYEVTPYLVPACGVGAPHRRDRVWFIAFMENADSVGRYGQGVLHQQPGGASIIGTGEVGLSGVRKELEDAAFELAKDTQRFRRDSGQPEEESGAGGFGQSGAGDHVRVCGETGTDTHPDGERRQEYDHSTEPDQQKQYSGGIPERTTPDATGIMRNPRRPEPAGQFRQVGAANGCNVDAPDANELDGNHTGYGASELPQHKASGILEDMPSWHDFPTQSPVCGGNDGLPAGLDGITFPKWRSESIKAYGNAIVPQVAYQIFKAINECERN